MGPGAGVARRQGPADHRVRTEFSGRGAWPERPAACRGRIRRGRERGAGAGNRRLSPAPDQGQAGCGGSQWAPWKQMLSAIAAGQAEELPLVIKADVHGSLEAIRASLENISNDAVAVRILHGAVGGINESDVTLAAASKAIVIGFNVRASPQARDLIRRDKRRGPVLLDHLQRDRRRQVGAVRAAVARSQGGLPWQRRDPRGVQHLQGRQGCGMHGDRRHDPARRPGAPVARQTS